MAKIDWPAAGKRNLIGKRISRADGPLKSTGAAKYSYDVNRPGMLWAKVVTSPHAHAQVESVDTAAAAAITGVEGVWHDATLIGKEVLYTGQIVAAVAARTEEIAQEAIRHVKVQYKVLPHQVVDTDPSLAAAGPPAKREAGNVDDALAKADVVVTGDYGIPAITHCCLESHGEVNEVKGDAMFVWPSTQFVSGYAAPALGEPVGVLPNKISVDCQHMGGGFGSKFDFMLAPGAKPIAAILSKQTGKPVKLMLDRDLELAIAGNRPSAYAKIKVGAAKDGTITAFDAEVWSTGGQAAFFNGAIMPYPMTKVPNLRVIGKRILTHRGATRAWRAPNHPQACLLTMSALADTAAKLGMDELEFFLHNAALTDRADVYREELQIAADMIDYKKKAHLRGDPKPGPIKRGIGISLHTWGGLGHPSECDVSINGDGSVEAKIGTQDLGVGTRTCIAQVVAETLGLPLDAVKVEIGKNSFPSSRGSGGSTTIGGISVSSRKAATEALNALLAVVATKLGVAADALEAADGKIRQIDKPHVAMSWEEACRLLGREQITKRGINVPAESRAAKLIDMNVGGVQMADVSVDIETGVVTLNEMVAVQDCGLVVNPKTCESQVYGALIMGVAYGLYEEAIYDAKTGRMVNADMEFYRLAGLKDVGKLKVHLMTGPAYDSRGIIGIGEPPAISPGAALSNAVANACGVRVPSLPLTPDRVIAALQKGGIA
jgi:xanthine dehydrogenase YagR molybdenum-binding subunit